MNNKCKHLIEWDDLSLHRPNPDKHDILVIMGKCKLCKWDFRKQFEPGLETKIDYDLNLFMPYDLSSYEQIITNIHIIPYGPLKKWGKAKTNI